MIYIANFKQNKTLEETVKWLENYNFNKLSETNHTVVMCPSEIFLISAYNKAKDIDPNLTGYKFFIGVQNLSEYDNGAHTGEVGVSQIKGYAQYAIIGHSERRKNGETNDQILNKISKCLDGNIIPVVCFSTPDEVESIKSRFSILDKILFAYEPLFAIGTGNPASRDNITDMWKSVGLNSIIYGGSVDLDVAKSIKELDFISGFLIGNFSLDPLSFSKLLEI